MIFEIWQSKDKTESSIFSMEDRTREQLDFLTYDSSGKKMILRKSFIGTSMEAKAIYNTFVEQEDIAM